jgi:hypothetical protein
MTKRTPATTLIIVVSPISILPFVQEDPSSADIKTRLGRQCFRDDAGLLDASATTLNQNDQHDDKENTGDYPDDRGIVHLNSPFFSG